MNWNSATTINGLWDLRYVKLMHLAQIRESLDLAVGQQMLTSHLK